MIQGTHPRRLVPLMIDSHKQSGGGPCDDAGDDRDPGGANERDRAADEAPRQETWFGIADDDSASPSGPFAGVVFNRPIEQVLTYRVPGRLKRIIQPGQRVRVPLGRGDRLAVGYCVRVDAAAAGRSRSGADQGRGRGARPPALDRRQDARADPLDGGLLRLFLGPGARCRGTGGGQEARGDADRDIPDRARGDSSRLASGDRSSAGCRPSRAAVLEVLCRSDEPLTVADVCRMAKCTTVPIQALRKQGLVHTVRGGCPSDCRAMPANRSSDRRRPMSRRARRRSSDGEPATAAAAADS